MDAETRRMLADLGVERRDAISAPEEGARGGGPRQTPQSERLVRNNVEAHRARFIGDAAEGADDLTTRIRAWNSKSTNLSRLKQQTDSYLDESNFDNDEVSGLLENRFSGQGHRAGLQHRLEGRRPIDDQWDAMDARVGEERRMYVQERAGRGENYTASGRRDSGFASGRDATPRSMPGNHNFPGYANAPQRPANHARAPSPRRQGTVRFGPGGQRIQRGPVNTLPALANPALQAAAAMRAAAEAASGPHVAPSAVNVATASSGNSAQPARASTTTSTSSSSSITAQAAPSVASSATGAAAATPNRNIEATRVVTDSYQADRYRIEALHHVAHPGEECEKHYTKYPDRRPYFGQARDQLVREVTGFVKLDNDAKTADYLNRHADRKWMLDAAKKAREQVENDSEAEIEAYCAANPMQPTFLRAARAVFTPSPANLMDDAVPSTNDELVTTASATPSPRAAAVDSSSTETSDTEASAETDITTPPSRLGTLAATFFSAAGAFLGIHHVGVNAPVQATMTVTTRREGYDPRELIGSIDALAQSMFDRSQGLEGVHLADDGLWENEEEL